MTVREKRARTTNYFKRVKQLLDEKRERYDSSYDTEERAKLKAILHLLVEVENYLKHLDFLDDKGRERIDVYYSTCFDVVSVCRELAISRVTFDKFISRTNKKLSDKVTDRLLQCVEDDLYNDALLEFRLSTRTFKATGLLMMEFLNELPDETPLQSYKLTECVDELQLLRIYSMHAMETNIGKMDRSKLIYLLYVLSSGAESVRYEGELLTTYLQGNLKSTLDERALTFKEFIQELQDKSL